MIHHDLPGLPGATLVRETRLNYSEDPVATRLIAAYQRGYGGDIDPLSPDGDKQDRSPPAQFQYSEAVVDGQLRFIDPESLENLPHGSDGQAYRFVDLDGVGIPGILTEQAGHWYYKPPRGPASFGPLRSLPTMPSVGRWASGQSFVDLDGDGRKSLALISDAGHRVAGFVQREPGPLSGEDDWGPFRALEQIPQVDLSSPRTQLIDLSGDGLADILVDEGERYTWYPRLGALGYGPPRVVHKPSDERAGPQEVYGDARQAFYFSERVARFVAVSRWPGCGSR